MSTIDPDTQPLIDMDLTGIAQPAPLMSRVARVVLNRLGVQPDALSDAEPAVAEMVTNACEHGCSPISLLIYCQAGLVSVHVRDGLTAPVVFPTYKTQVRELTFAELDALPFDVDTSGEQAAERGRGLRLITQASRGRCGCEPHHTWKSVWAAFPTSLETAPTPQVFSAWLAAGSLIDAPALLQAVGAPLSPASTPTAPT